MIQQLKFQHRLYQAHALATLLMQQIPIWYADHPLPDLVLPVPLHPLRIRERGFNQAVEIARPACRKFKLPLDLDGVQRIKHTAAQSGLDANERRLNLTQAFVATKDYTGRSIAILDDVVTTGQTMQELCRVLLKQGAVKLEVWCCARRG